jgi:hypothetical protein
VTLDNVSVVKDLRTTNNQSSWLTTVGAGSVSGIKGGVEVHSAIGCPLVAPSFGAGAMDIDLTVVCHLLKTDDEAPASNFVRVNVLRDLPPLPKVHHMYGGLPSCYIDPTQCPPGANATNLEMMVDFARIMGSFPAQAANQEQMDLVVQIVINATARHPTKRQPHLVIGGSPFMCAKDRPQWCRITRSGPLNGRADPLNTTDDAAEVERWRSIFASRAALLASSNKRFGSNVAIGYTLYDLETFSWSPEWIGKPATQPIIDAVGRKNEIIFNLTRNVFPSTMVNFYAYGGSGWHPMAYNRDCYNLIGCSVLYPQRCPDGWCMDAGTGTYKESFVHDPFFSGFDAVMYRIYEPELSRTIFARTAANAKTLFGHAGPNVVPTIALGCGYHRNESHRPNINYQGNISQDEYTDMPFFDDANFDFTGVPPMGGYDTAYSALMGAMINQGDKFNSNGVFSAFGPWEQARGADFYPSIFDERSSASAANNGSTVNLDHFVEYVRAATTELSCPWCHPPS